MPLTTWRSCSVVTIWRSQSIVTIYRSHRVVTICSCSVDVTLQRPKEHFVLVAKCEITHDRQKMF